MEVSWLFKVKPKKKEEEDLQNVYPLEDLGKTQSRGDKERQFGAEKGQAVFYYLVKAFIHFSISSDEMRCSALWLSFFSVTLSNRWLSMSQCNKYN